MEALSWIVVAVLDKYDEHGSWVGTLHTEGNAITDAGANRILSNLTGKSVVSANFFSGSNSRIGVGSGATPTTQPMTDLEGERHYQAVDSVSVLGRTATWVATFPKGVASFEWNEWGIDNGSVSGSTVVGPLLNRKAVSFGQKGDLETWRLTVSVTIT